jgi:hypothetical protein
MSYGKQQDDKCECLMLHFDKKQVFTINGTAVVNMPEDAFENGELPAETAAAIVELLEKKGLISWDDADYGLSEAAVEFGEAEDLGFEESEADAKIRRDKNGNWILEDV